MKPFVILAFILWASPAGAGYPSYLLHGIEMGQDVNAVRIAIRDECKYFEIFRSDTDARIADRQFQPFTVANSLCFGTEGDISITAKLCRVRQKVKQNLAEFYGVG